MNDLAKPTPTRAKVREYLEDVRWRNGVTRSQLGSALQPMRCRLWREFSDLLVAEAKAGWSMPPRPPGACRLGGQSQRRPIVDMQHFPKW